MRFDSYLNKMGQLHYEGVISNFQPQLLRRIGGSLALAAHDAHHVRVEEDAFLWVDMRRLGAERWEEGQRA